MGIPSSNKRKNKNHRKAPNYKKRNDKPEFTCKCGRAIEGKNLKETYFGKICRACAES